MNFGKIKRAVVAATIAAATLVGGGFISAAPAQADESHSITGGKFFYGDYGDVITVYDTKADGYWVMVQAVSGSGGASTCMVSKAGTHRNCDWNLSDSKTYTFTIYIEKGYTTIRKASYRIQG
ncbi:MAG: hypothetical protein ACRDOV_00405 [Streptomyces sp.]